VKEICHLLAYNEVVNLFDKNEIPIKKSSNTIITSKGVSLEIIAQESKCILIFRYKTEVKAIHVADREDPQGCETSRLPHFLENQLTDCGEVSQSRARPGFTPPPPPRKIPGTHFC
jgi:hypothetical protein